MDFDEECNRENFAAYCEIRDNTIEPDGVVYDAPLALVCAIESARGWGDVLDAVLEVAMSTAGTSFEAVVRGIHALALVVPYFEYEEA